MRCFCVAKNCVEGGNKLPASDDDGIDDEMGTVLVWAAIRAGVEQAMTGDAGDCGDSADRGDSADGSGCGDCSDSADCGDSADCSDSGDCSASDSIGTIDCDSSESLQVG